MLKKDGFGCKCRVIKMLTLSMACVAQGDVDSICKGAVRAQ